MKKICADKNIGFSIEETGDFVRVVFKRQIATARKRPQDNIENQIDTSYNKKTPAKKRPQAEIRY